MPQLYAGGIQSKKPHVQTHRKEWNMFTIDVMSRVPVYEQLIKQVEDQVLKGIMKEGDKMPSVRSLSMELSTNPNTIQKAYMELDRRGILVSVPGKGSFISAEALKTVGNQSKDCLLYTSPSPRDTR